MAIKANNPSKTRQRIEKAKRRYKVVEEKTDLLSLWLVDSRYTLAIVVAGCAGVLVWRFW